jgi:glycosyltransferase involved in cell wall biosynthesis
VSFDVNPVYSVCITNFNSGDTIQDSLDSILREADGRFELVVSDNYSTDASATALEELSVAGKVRLSREKCSRGVGRQIAFENSAGRYIISGLDTDDILLPGRLTSVLDFYHNKCEGKVLRVKEGGITIAPRQLIQELGGWRDLQFGENWDLSERAARIGKYSWTFFLVANRSSHPDKRTFFGMHKRRYTRYRDNMRLGRSPYIEGERVGSQERIDRFIATLGLLVHPSYNKENVAFTSYEVEYFVDSKDWWHREGQLEERERKWYKRYLNQTLA